MRDRPLFSILWRLSSEFSISIRLVLSSMLAIGGVSSRKNGRARRQPQAQKSPAG
jgi:hypothetical protein